MRVKAEAVRFFGVSQHLAITSSRASLAGNKVQENRMDTESEELLKRVEEARGELTAFDRWVAMTMAILAALLAFVTMLSHRVGTEGIAAQVEASRLRTDANIYHTQATDQWGYYQAKNIRSTEYQGFLELLSVLPKTAGADGSDTNSRLAQRWSTQIRKYEEHDLPDLKAKAEALEAKALQLENESAPIIEKAYRLHHQEGRLDMAELALELALIACSLAVLTKWNSFWYGGIVLGIVGAAVVLSAQFVV
jgi:hypothetical protein